MLKIFRGDSKTIKVTITNNGEAFDLTGFTIKLTIKKNNNNEDLLLTTDIAEIEDPTSGIVVFYLSPTQTGALPTTILLFDVEVRKDDGKELLVYTVIKDKLEIVKDLT